MRKFFRNGVEHNEEKVFNPRDRIVRMVYPTTTWCQSNKGGSLGRLILRDKETSLRGV